MGRLVPMMVFGAACAFPFRPVPPGSGEPSRSHPYESGPAYRAPGRELPDPFQEQHSIDPVQLEINDDKARLLGMDLAQGLCSVQNCALF